MTVGYEIRDQVAVIGIDNGKANALSPDVLDALHDAFGRTEADPSVRVVVLAGKPGIFSGGFDLNVMREDFVAAIRLVHRGGELVRRLYGLTKPVVAACTGHAIAGGALLLLGCDLRVGADGPFKIGLNEVAIGMVLPDWAIAIARERLDPTAVQRATMLARIHSPGEAVSAGFLDVLVAPEDVLDVAVNEGRALAMLNADAYAKSVTAVRGRALEILDATLAADAKFISEMAGA